MIPINILIKDKSNQHSLCGGIVAQIKVKFRMAKKQSLKINPRNISSSIGKTIKESTIMIKPKKNPIGRRIAFQDKTNSKIFTRLRNYPYRKCKMN